MTVQIGVVAPAREEIVFGAGDPGSVIAFARQAEQSGFDSVWVGESLLARPRFDPLVLLGGIAAVTARATLGTAILLPALRHPVLLAHSAATLDQIARGRLVLGVGAGGRVRGTEAELAAVGVEMRDRVGRVVEGTRLARALWAGAVENWESNRWPLRDVDLGIRPAQPGGPPVWLGGDAPATLARAGRWFDGWMPYLPSPAEYASRWATVREAAAAAGRDPASLVAAIFLNVTIDDDPAAARAEQDVHLRSYYDTDPAVMRAIQASHAGTVASAAEWAAGFIEAGARHLIVRMTVRRPADQLPAAAELAAALRVVAAEPPHGTGGT